MDCKEILKKLLTEWSEFDPGYVFSREFDNTLLFDDNILTIIGPRRAGKTYLCYQIMAFLKTKLPQNNIMFINMEDERLYPLTGNELTDLLPAYYEIFNPAPNKKLYVIIDEIQNISNWSKWARRITEQNKNIKLILTGSNSKLLSTEIATELRGRACSFRIFPLSFKEFIKFKAIDFDLKMSLYSNKRSQIKKIFNDYFKRGGFPAIIDLNNYEHILREYYKAIFHRDLIERFAIKNIKLFEDFLRLEINAFSSLCSISSMAKKCESLGHKLSKNTINQYFYYAQESFLLFTAPIYSYKIKNQMLYPKKLYAIDHGLIQSVRFSFSEDYGRLLENIVFLELLRRNNEIYYYEKNAECDFVIKERNKITKALQVAKSITDPKTRKQEINGLIAAMNEFGLSDGLILTDDHNEDIKIGKQTIKVLPVWHWLLLD